MAIKDEVSDSLDTNLSFNELLSAFYDLFDECRIMRNKYNYALSIVLFNIMIRFLMMV